MFTVDPPASRVVRCMAMEFLGGSGYDLRRGRAPVPGVSWNGRLHMLRLAVVSAMVAGLLLSGCTGQNEALDDGWTMITEQDYGPARAHYQSMLAEDPNNPYANLNLGVAYEETGENEMAAKHYQIAIANGKNARIGEVSQDGNVAPRSTTVAKIAEENLRCLGANICQAPI